MPNDPQQRREVEIAALTLDQATNSPVVVLREKGGEEAIPIWIGFVEASAIAMELEQIKVGRPLTHDLLKNIIASLGNELKEIEVTDLRDNTYFAELRLAGGASDVLIDSRPSDAIALAVRFGAPIFIAEKVFEASQKLKKSVELAAGEQGAEVQSAEDAKKKEITEKAAQEPPAHAQFHEENREKWEELLAKLDPNKLSKQ